MIPKIIHYCWFGNNNKPAKISNYIDSWKKFCPDYVVMEWNEQTFNIKLNKYTEDAYKYKKWAFVSDVARLWCLYNYGGIYMDTDVEVIKPLDDLIQNDGFIGFEDKKWIGSNIIGSIKNSIVIKELLQQYEKINFIDNNGALDLTTNVQRITDYFVGNGLILNGLKQRISDFEIYPKEWFNPYNYINGKISKSHNTYTIHWYTQSWIGHSFIRTKLSQLYHKLFGIN